MLTFGSLFAGIGGFDKGFHDAGMRCAWQAEIDQAARGVLARRTPDVPRYADIRDCGAHNLTPVDVICGGFPCQDLSVAGRRTGLAGARSGLFYEMTRIVDELRPMLLVWENVPGLLSSNSGRDFASVLVELERVGYSGCWTTLDAQWFGLAQRRQRVFGVFARGDIGAAVCAEILSLAARLPWNTEKGRAKRARVAPTLESGTNQTGGTRPPGTTVDTAESLIAYALNSHAGAADADVSNRNHASGGPVSMGVSENLAFSLRGGRTQNVAFGGNDTRGERAVSSALTNHGSGRYDFESETFVAATLNSGGNNGGFRTEPGEHLVFQQNQRNEVRDLGGIAGALPSQPGMKQQNYLKESFGVRRLTPLECERLQGFPDGWTDGQPDSARYRQLGNAVAVPVARWIGQRIVAVLT